MPRILLTGMSGTGKSTALGGLARRGWSVIDTDDDGWKTSAPDGDLVWDEPRMSGLLDSTEPGEHLAVCGCVANQGRFYDRFDAVVLLTAPIDVILHRVTQRITNPYGKSPAERTEIRANMEIVEPLLHQSADLIIDTSTASEDEVTERIIAFVARIG